MPNIRIKDIPTTASATSSTDFIGIDGSANGTRKLNAYSPTFGGNLTVSGTGTSSIGGNTKIGNPANANQRLVVDGAVAGVGVITTNTGLSGGYLYSDGGTGGVVAAWNGGNYSALSILGTTVTIGTGASGTTAATITSVGNVLIGTAIDGGQKLQVNGTAAITGQIRGANIVASNLGSADAGFYGTAGADAGSGHRLALVRTDTPTGGSALLSAFGAAVVEVNATTGLNTGTRALTIDTSANATFAGQITASGISHKLGSGGTGSANALLTIDGSSASSYGPYIVLQRNSTNKWQFGTYSGINGGTSDDFLLYNPTAANEALKIAAATSNATFAGTIGGMTKGDRDPINDDAVASFAPLKDRGFLVINNPDYSQNALIAYFKSGSYYLLYTVVKSADVGIYSTTTLTGTTGTDGKLNIGYNSAGGVATIYIENRLGGYVNVQRWAFGGSD